jgi:phosphate transport system substrate-binding protein
MVLNSSDIKKKIISSVLEFSLNVDAYKQSGKYSQNQISEILSLAIEINHLINALDTNLQQNKYRKPNLKAQELAKMKRALELSFKYNSDINSIAIDIGENIAIANRLLSKGIDYILLNLSSKNFKMDISPRPEPRNPQQAQTKTTNPQQNLSTKPVTKAKKKSGVGFFGFLFFMSVLGAFAFFIYNSFFDKHATTVTSLVKEYRSDRKLSSVQRPEIKSDLKVFGTKSVLFIFDINKKDFANQNPQLDFDVEGGDSGIAISDLISGQISLAAVSRIPNLQERKQALANQRPLADHRIALDSVVFFVNKENVLDKVTIEDLKNIYGQENIVWNDISSSALNTNKISRFSLSKESGTFHYFLDRVMLGERVSEDIIHMYKPSQLIEMVANNKNAIGFCSLSVFMNKEVLNTEQVKILKIASIFDENGTKPVNTKGQLELQTIQTGEYPLTRYLYLISAGELNNAQARFIDFMRSPLIQKQLVNYGLVGIL